MGGKVKPPSGARPQPEAAPQEAPAEMIDVGPLPKAVNPFLFLAAVLSRYPLDGPAGELQGQQVAWLNAMAASFECDHDQPIMLLAAGRCALSADDREWLRGVLDGIEVAGAQLEGAGA